MMTSAKFKFDIKENYLSKFTANGSPETWKLENYHFIQKNSAQQILTYF